MNILYMVPEFPSQTHAFFWREIEALRQMGMTVTIISTRSPPKDACRHDFSERAHQETQYLFPSNWLFDSISLLCRPYKLTRAIKYISSLEKSSIKQSIFYFALLVPAERLRRLSVSRNADHLHVHSFANSAHVAALSRLLGGCPYSLAGR